MGLLLAPMLFPIAFKSLELRQQSKTKTLKSKTKELQSYLKPYLLHIVLLQHNEKQEALTLNKGISKSSTTQL
jgi:hypothetical protein